MSQTSLDNTQRVDAFIDKNSVTQSFAHTLVERESEGTSSSLHGRFPGAEILT